MNKGISVEAHLLAPDSLYLCDMLNVGEDK